MGVRLNDRQRLRFPLRKRSKTTNFPKRSRQIFERALTTTIDLKTEENNFSDIVCLYQNIVQWIVIVLMRNAEEEHGLEADLQED